MSASPAPIVVPIALSKTNRCTITLPWFVQRTEYNPTPASYQALINGKEAFGAVYDAIANARSSVEIICWGFQPSMYFKRGSDRAPCIGDLLIAKAVEGVKVRVLCWADALPVSQISENNLPGYSLARRAFTHGEERDQLTYDSKWFMAVSYGTDELGRSKDSPLASYDFHYLLDFSPALRSLNHDGALRALRNIQFFTRGFSHGERNDIAARERADRADSELDDSAIAAFKYMPTHHQKTVLVDYEIPGQAVGFVMGHNMLDAYWDDDAHRYVRQAAAQGRNGATPRQDMSCRLTGPVLTPINHNFCSAWQRRTGQDLLTPRQAIAEQLAIRRAEGSPVMAQITRTQSQEGVQDIKRAYLQAINNVTSFIYIENQYFRWPPLARAIKTSARNLFAGGRDPGRHSPVYVFVVTNADDDALYNGELSTYRMLDSLGQGNAMPAVARQVRGDALQAQRNAVQAQYEKAKLDEQAFRRYGDPNQAQAARERQHAAQQQLPELDRQIQDNNDADEALLPLDIFGLKVIVCTLVAPDSPAPWINTYVHSKIMVVDDVFLTHGSANINTRSMEVDSEINISHEHAGVTQAVRERLWEIHTQGKMVSKNNHGYGNCLDAKEAFQSWQYIANENKRRQKDAGLSYIPFAPLIAFRRKSPRLGRRD